MTATLIMILLGIPFLAIVWWVGRRLLQAGLLVLGALDARWRK